MAEWIKPPIGVSPHWFVYRQRIDEYRNEVRKMAHKHEMNISQFVRWLIDKQRKEDEGK